MPERSNGPGCKPGGPRPTGVQIPPSPHKKMFLTTIYSIVSFSFFLNIKGGISFPSSIAQKVSPSFAFALGVAEFDSFDAGANFFFSPSASFFFPSSRVSIRFDSSDFFASVGAGIGPGIQSQKQKILAYLGLETFGDFGVWIEPRRFSAHLSPIISGFFGSNSGYIISVLFGFSVFSP